MQKQLTADIFQLSSVGDDRNEIYENFRNGKVLIVRQICDYILTRSNESFSNFLFHFEVVNSS